jgi:hypothetical protein
MISRPLIDLLNSGEAVALVGSGISTEAKLPSWWSLFDQIATDLHSKALDTRKAREHATKNRLPEAFDMLSNLTSREDIYSRVIALIEKVKTVGKYHTMLADWPFKLYITTNFDHLLEDASKGRLTSIGNRGKELPKMSGGVSNVVWHIHGGTKLSRDISQLVVSKADYDDFYPTSNVVSSLKSITSTHQCIIVGFGFNDRDLLSVMHAVGRLGNSGRPSFAFLAYDETTKDIKSQQDELRRKYNVEVIPYFKREQRHDELYRLMCGYQSFVVRRSISLGRLPKATPTYDSLASSLKIQNNLDIGELSANHAGLRSTLIGARVLAHIREHPAGDCDLASVYRSNDPTEAEVFQCLATLRAKGLVTPPPPLSLTPAYQAKADAAQGRLEVTKTLFLSSLQNRASDNTNLDEPAQKRVVAVVSHFLDELCRERGLGVAQNLATSDAEQASRRTVSLIQRLPDHFAQCASHEEALMAVNLTADILTKSSEAESTFLGHVQGRGHCSYLAPVVHPAA